MMAKRLKANQRGSGGFDPDRLCEFASRIGAAKDDLDESRGTHAQLVKDAVETLELNGKALKQALRVKRMETIKAQQFLRDLDSYCHALGIWAQGDLLDRVPEQPQAPAEIVALQ